MARINIPKAQPARKRFNENRADPSEVLGVPNTGASRRGNTYYKRLRTCPREHALYTAGFRRRGDSEALTVGLTFHHALEVYYRTIQAHQAAFKGQIHPEALGFAEFVWGNLAEAEKAAFDAIAPMAGVEGYEATYAEIERMLAGYFDGHRRRDQWRVVAVEENLEYSDDGIEYSARLDLIVEDYTRGGMWVVEHKSARSITPELLAGYQLDQQVLGQIWLVEHCVDLSAYPPLRGVLVNITTKHKTGPKLERLEVSRSRKHLAAFESSMRSWYEVAQVLEDLDWPQALGSCAGPSRYFSRCDYYDLCFGHPDVSVEQLVREEPPLGFIRKTAE